MFLQMVLFHSFLRLSNIPLQICIYIYAKTDVIFIIGEWNAKVGSQEIPGVTGKFGLGVQNEAEQRLRLTVFCQENALVIANTLLQQHKRESTHGITGMSTCYSFELCIQMDTSFLFSFAFCFSSFHSYLEGLPRQPFCFFAFLFHGDELDPCLLYNVMNLHP